ncbi:hypothetical protein Mapa_014982 [Marchantia paleacea]|nr:hypothetical protein Mapa_014982 [Marchantia paleacea]
MLIVGQMEYPSFLEIFPRFALNLPFYRPRLHTTLWRSLKKLPAAVGETVEALSAAGLPVALRVAGTLNQTSGHESAPARLPLVDFRFGLGLACEPQQRQRSFLPPPSPAAEQRFLGVHCNLPIVNDTRMPVLVVAQGGVCSVILVWKKIMMHVMLVSIAPPFPERVRNKSHRSMKPCGDGFVLDLVSHSSYRPCQLQVQFY